MLIGSNSSDFDFGGPESSTGSAPLPSDVARSISAAPSPADAARSGRKSGMARKSRPDDDSPSRASRPAGPGTLSYEDSRSRRTKIVVLSVVLVALTVFSLFVDTGFARLNNPIEVFTCYGIALQQLFVSVADPSQVLQGNEILQSGHLAYFRILTRAAVTVMTVMCGAALAIAGSLYQSAFRNPIASPSMLGVSSAIQLGDAILVLIFGLTAGVHLGERYLICYACVAVVMTALFVFARFMNGKGRPFNVVNLLLTAMIITQIIGVIVTYITTFIFTIEEWEAYNSISEALVVDVGLFGWAALLAAFVIGLVPVWILRFRLNGLNFDDTEMRLLGINSSRLRFVSLICGTILVMGVQVQMGTVAMIALVVPHVSRIVFGAEFRKQLWGNVLIGSSLLVLCRILLGFVPAINSILPVSVIVNFVVLPFFVWMLATQQRRWE